MERTSDYLNGQVTAGVADKINPAAENLLQGEQAGVESGESEAESKGPAFGSSKGRRRPSLSTILATLTALSLLSVFFLAASVTSFFSDGRKSASRRRRR
jgi:hypothetical protein